MSPKPDGLPPFVPSWKQLYYLIALFLLLFIYFLVEFTATFS